MCNLEINELSEYDDFFQDEIDEGLDSDIIAFAKKNFPKLESHLNMEENVSDNL